MKSVLLFAALLTVSACGGGSPPPPVDTNARAQVEQVKLEMALLTTRVEQLERQVRMVAEKPETPEIPKKLWVVWERRTVEGAPVFGGPPPKAVDSLESRSACMAAVDENIKERGGDLETKTFTAPREQGGSYVFTYTCLPEGTPG